MQNELSNQSYINTELFNNQSEQISTILIYPDENEEINMNNINDQNLDIYFGIGFIKNITNRNEIVKKEDILYISKLAKKRTKSYIINKFQSNEIELIKNALCVYNKMLIQFEIIDDIKLNKFVDYVLLTRNLNYDEFISNISLEVNDIIKDLIRINVLIRTSQCYQGNRLSEEQVNETINIIETTNYNDIIKYKLIPYIFSKGYKRLKLYTEFLENNFIMKTYIKLENNELKKWIISYMFIVYGQVFSDGNHRTGAYSLFKYGLNVIFNDNPSETITRLYTLNIPFFNFINETKCCDFPENKYKYKEIDDFTTTIIIMSQKTLNIKINY